MIPTAKLSHLAVEDYAVGVTVAQLARLAALRARLVSLESWLRPTGDAFEDLYHRDIYQAEHAQAIAALRQCLADLGGNVS